GTVKIGLLGAGGTVLGTLSLNLNTGAGTVTLVSTVLLFGGIVTSSNSGTLNVLAGAHHLTNLGGTPEATVLASLSHLGVPVTDAAQLNQLDFNQQNPIGLPYTVSGAIAKTSDTTANVTYTVSGTPGAIVAGQATAPVTDFDANHQPFTFDAAAT